MIGFHKAIEHLQQGLSQFGALKVGESQGDGFQSGHGALLRGAPKSPPQGHLGTGHPWQVGDPFDAVRHATGLAPGSVEDNEILYRR